VSVSQATVPATRDDATQFVPSQTVKGLEHVVTFQARLVPQLATCFGDSQRVTPGSHPQLPLPKQMFVFPPQGALFHVPSWHCSRPEPPLAVQRVAPSVHRQLPPLQTGRSLGHGDWGVQVLFTHRCGVVLFAHWVAFGLLVQPHVALPARQTGVFPVQANAWFSQTLFTQRCGTLLFVH
jgi:hypothetical protein